MPDVQGVDLLPTTGWVYRRLLGRWAFTAYLLTATVSGPIYGKLSDLFGRRPLFMISVTVFLIGSILSGLSQEMWQLIAFRGLQGLGAGALFPIALAIIADIFAPSERGKYQGLFGAVFGVSSLLGPGLGGLITDNFGWQWIFYVNVPIGAVVLVIIWRTLPTVRDPNAERNIDYLGAVLFVAALVPFLIGFTNKQFGEWTDPEVGGLIALGLLLGAAFIWAESRPPPSGSGSSRRCWPRSSFSSCCRAGAWERARRRHPPRTRAWSQFTRSNSVA
ncbi:MAG: MFS transporter [Chloroflexota bacterium]|nr:MFS transporter [Chloroflexota bacterium]